MFRGSARTAVRDARLAISAGDAAQAQAALKKAIRALDHAAGKGVIHKKNAGRRKARLMKCYASIQPQVVEAPKVEPVINEPEAVEPEPKTTSAKKAAATKKTTSAKKATTTKKAEASKSSTKKKPTASKTSTKKTTSKAASSKSTTKKTPAKSASTKKTTAKKTEK